MLTGDQCFVPLPELSSLCRERVLVRLAELAKPIVRADGAVDVHRKVFTASPALYAPNRLTAFITNVHASPHGRTSFGVAVNSATASAKS
jgi:hypothetical protein